ncbi:oligosaccharide flippase family protein [Frondihabitans sp. PAMC 28766]|uniref:oligosaccharide flippase family protein n=1 Tax=Frondihabitans sp. PAMC 28766 TaxID=1795630 RepID=UPI0012FF6D8F|nr:oligosaccharide flippase family protein [Frondihabitans sp. PAMC 28766]
MKSGGRGPHFRSFMSWGSDNIKWLPIGQGISFLVSTGGFALLARSLGPTPYAHFAVILFVFTASSLLADLSPLGFLIVHGRSPATLKSARSATLASAISGTIVLLGAVAVLNEFLPGSRIDWYESGLLVAAFVAQMTAQVPRSRLVLARRYRAMAIVDATTLVAGVSIAVAGSIWTHSALVLTLQLATTAVLRALIGPAVAQKVGMQEGPAGNHGVSAFAAHSYGLRNIPLNLATYLGRSLDSAFLPTLIPAVGAAGYARSYQLVIVPITQLQMALGASILDRLSRAMEATGQRKNDYAKWLWSRVEALAVISGLLIGIFSFAIQAVLFGPKWPEVNVILAAVACQLPSLATATHYSWTLQVDGKFRQTVMHLAIMTMPPVAVLVVAGIGNTQSAVVALVLSAFVQSMILAVANSARRPFGFLRTAVRASVSWSVLAAIFIAEAQISHFWRFNFGH